MVFYRKYRPQTITDLDSVSLRETLHAILLKAGPSFDALPHAFLFTGPKGLGKTSTARIIAKIVNCIGREPSKENVEPCNDCDQCKSITNGSNLDILEIDAASNRGIDEIRDLKDKIRLAPSAAHKKIYIIDEVHMLTTEAFNALLKTLEEPPSHALFMLCTTEPQKVPQTILSRCFHIPFHFATEEELVRSFTRIVKSEGIIVDQEILKTIAKLADGGFRDGAKILEELAAHADGKKITKELIEEKYKVTSVAANMQAIVTFLENRDVKGAISLIASLHDQGVDVSYFFQQLMETMHVLLLSRMGVEESSKFKVQSSKLSNEEIIYLLQLLAKAYTDAKYTVLPQLPYEILIIQWCQEKESGVAAAPDTGVYEKEGVTIPSLKRKIGNIEKAKAMYADTKAKTKPAKKEEGMNEPPVTLLQYTANGKPTQEWMDTFWKSLILRTKEHNHSVAGVLRGCVVRSYDGKALVIETAYKFHKEKLDDLKAKTLLENVCKDLIGNSITITVELKSK
ncbi:MAG: DNA polymerase III subunit gamma/tau [Candidatus Levybacteria bacterium]|nr:DNA polymerase III subunit gamma/tau [Candidatus Levybacteria bacterium]